MIDQPNEEDGAFAELVAAVRRLASSNPLESASITRGPGVRVAVAGGLRLDGDGSLVGGSLTVARDQVSAGGAFIRGTGGGQVGAGGTLIGGDGNISHSSGTTRFNGSVSTGGGVAADGGVSGASASFAGSLGAGSAYIVGQSNVGSMYSRGDIATETKIFIGATDVGFAIGAARYVADTAHDLATAAADAAYWAQQTANGRVTQAQLQSVLDDLTVLRGRISAIAGRVNEHQTWWEQAGKPNRPPLVQG